MKNFIKSLKMTLPPYKNVRRFVFRSIKSIKSINIDIPPNIHKKIVTLENDLSAVSSVIKYFEDTNSKHEHPESVKKVLGNIICILEDYRHAVLNKECEEHYRMQIVLFHLWYECKYSRYGRTIAPAIKSVFLSLKYQINPREIVGLIFEKARCFVPEHIVNSIKNYFEIAPGKIDSVLVNMKKEEKNFHSEGFKVWW